MNFELANIENNGTSAIMRINRKIDADPKKGITGEMFTKEHDALVDAGVQNLLVTINSSGGNTFQGWEIFSTIAGSPMKTETQVVGVAASMAGVISQAGDKRTIKSNGLFHAHAPRPEEGKQVGAGVLNQVYNQIKTVFNENSAMGENEVNEMLSGETFFNAETAINNGLFDEVIPTTGRTPKISESMDAEQIMNIINEFTSDPAVSGKQKVQKMKQVNELLSLSADAAESSTVEAIQGLQNTISDVEKINNELKSKNDGLVEQVEQMQNELATINKSKAIELIDNAIAGGKISSESKSQWLAKAIGDIENTSILLDSIKGAKAPKIMGEPGEAGKTIETVENSTWTFEDWSKKDPAGLSQMQVENNAKYEKLFNAYIA